MRHGQLETYFHTQINKAIERQNVDLSIFAINYLSDLLSRKAIRNPEENIYLVDLYAKSIEAQSQEERVYYLRRLGDHSLIVSGYFSDSLERKGGLSYYIDMGSCAYASIRKPAIYLELSSRYKDCVSVLHEVSESNRKYSSKDIVRLYDFWISTGSQTAKEELMMLGMITTGVEE